MSPLARRPGWQSSARVDLVIALVLCAVALLEVVLVGGNAASVAAAALWSLPLAVRRRAPLAPAVALLAAVLVNQVFGDVKEPLGVFSCALVAGYSAAAYGSWWRAALGALALFLALELHSWWAGFGTADSTFSALLVLALAWLSGRLVRRYRDRSGQLTVLAARLEREREASVRLAVAEERARMARELHDAIAHAVAGMVVQAAAAGRVLVGDPPRCRRALASVQATGRDAITELRRMLRILRTDEQTNRLRGFESPLPRAPRRRLPASWSPRLDVLLALGCFAVAEVSVLAGPGYDPGDRVVSALLVPAATLPLVVRRRFPLATLLIVVGAVATQQLITEWEPPARAVPSPGHEVPVGLSIAPLVALYSVAENASLRRALTGLALNVLVAVSADAVLMGRFGGLEIVVVWSFFLAFAFVPGRVVRLHRRQTERLRTLIARLEHERQARARLAIVEERTRLARELHDAIAHGVSVMVLQAGAAERVLAAKPDQAREATQAVQDTGRTVLDELRRLLGILASDEEQSPTTPRPSLGQLDALLTHVRQAGLPVELRLDGNPTNLPVGMEASAYRLIQEGLTNALKHAGTVPTTVTLRYSPDVLTVEIINAGRGEPVPPAPDPGHGLVGMRERVALYDGQLQAGPRPAGGFAVRARLPLGDGDA